MGLKDLALSRQIVIDKIAEIDAENIAPGNAEIIIIGAVMTGVPDAKMLAPILGIEIIEAMQFELRLRQAAIWVDDKIEFPDDAILWGLQSNIAEGKMTRTYDVKKQDWQYKMTPTGMQFVETLMNK